MAVGTVTKQAVDDLEPRTVNGRSVENHLWDAKLSGFGVKVTPAGAKSYLVQYRCGGRGANTKRVTIGRHGAPWTPAQARGEAERLLGEIKQGGDPQSEKKRRQREAVDLAFDKYALRFLELYGPRHWNERTLADNRRYLTAKGGPAPTLLGAKALPLIHRSDIAAVFDEVPATKPGFARNLYSVLRKMFAWAVERGDLDRSPMEGFRGPKVVASRDRVLSDDELRLAWIAAGNHGYPFGTLYRMLIATGQRRMEVALIDWRRLDRKTRELTLTGAETKNDKAHSVPLNDLAIAELDGIAGGDDWPTRGLVFTTNGKTPLGGFSKAKARLDAEMKALAEKLEKPLEIDPWRIHDFRRTFATGMQRLGVRFEVTEAALNHVSGSRSGVAGVYQRHDWRDEKRTALDAWSRHISASLTGNSSSNVVSLHG